MGKDLNGKELGRGLSQRPDGTYMARYVDRYKKRQTFYGKDLKTLRKKLEKERYESENGLFASGVNITVTEWFEEYLKLYKEGKVKDTTLYRIRQTYSPCKKDVLGSMRLQEVRAIHIQSLFNSLDAKGYTYGTIKLLKSLLNELFKKAIGNGYVLINPIGAVVMPKKTKCDQRFLTEEEQEMFLDVAKEYYHYDIFCVNLSMGARIGEVLGLKWSDIDFDNKTVHIQRTLHYSKVNEEEQCHFFFTTPKTETSDRIIPLLPETEKILKRVRTKQLRNKMLYASTWKQEAPFEDMVFTSQYGAPVRYGDVNRTIKKVVLKVNLQEEELAKFEGREPRELKGFSPHCFRHTFITNCKKKGVPYEIIKPYVGHSREEMTAYYDHNEPDIDYDNLKKISFLGVV
ncbi:MAG: tyrosine-type recombinase/integrase [Lachnospiraceae bacterium]|nr:tyrosine-type recombinase/integrase [Lachnospiraceae bacterium]